MTTQPVKIPRFYTDFMNSVNLNGHDSIVMRANATSSDDTCVELDVRLHGTHPALSYVVGMIDEDAAGDHPKTNEAVAPADKFKKTLGFADNTPQVDNYYLGPFDEESVLEIMAAADHTSARLDLEKRAEVLRAQADLLQREADIYGGLSSARGGIVDKVQELHRAIRREERKDMFKVIEGGKPAAAPKLA